ncbi:hypothetical protein BHE74_00009036 [Ensete ventricosum]|nr:hypothetical protein BHE74_00009036 [Ensete ventricosum]
MYVNCLIFKSLPVFVMLCSSFVYFIFCVSDLQLGSRKDLEAQDYPINRHPEFRYKTEFQSHEPEFDYLKSLEIEEKINKIKWCQAANNAMSMSLFLNDILFCSLSFVLLIFVAFMSVQVQEKKVKKIAEMNVDASQAVQNDNIASSSTISPRGYLPNGGCPERPHGRLNNELSMPPGGFPSLHLPVVVVLSQAYCS